MALTKTQVSELYVAIFNRASEGEGNSYWQQTGMSAAAAADAMLNSADAEAYFGDSLDSDQAFIEHIYENTLDKTVADDADGIAYWVGLLESGSSRGEVVSGLIDAVANYANSDDPATAKAFSQFQNRVAVSNYTADNLENAPADYESSLRFGDGLEVDDNVSTVGQAQQQVDQLEDEDNNPGIEGDTIRLTTGTDRVEGTENNDSFEAFLGQSELIGGVSNTLSSADNIEGGAGNDSLYAQLVEEFIGAGSTTIDVQPTINSVETIDFEARDLTDGGGSATVDAKNISGVDTIGSKFSDGDLVIENLTTLDENGSARNTEDLTISMDHTDNFNSDGDASDLTVYFDEDYLLSGETSTTSQANYWLLDEDSFNYDEEPLLNIERNGVSLEIDGTPIDIVMDQDVAEAADTWTAYANALQARIDQMVAEGVTELQGINVIVDRNNLDSTFNDFGVEVPIPAITLLDSKGRDLTPTGFISPEDATGAFDIYGNFDNVDSVDLDNPLAVGVELEKVGREGEGGDLMIGGKSLSATEGQGIEVFNIDVLGAANKPSNLGTITSTNDALNTVNIATGDEFAGSDDVASLTIRGHGDDARYDDVDTGPFGGTVETVNAAEFEGDLTIGNEFAAQNLNMLNATGGGDVTFTGNYEDDETFVVQTGAGNDVINLEGDQEVTVTTGNGDDVINGGTVSVDVNAGAGNDAVYVDNTGSTGDVLTFDTSAFEQGSAATPYALLYGRTVTVTVNGIDATAVVAANNVPNAQYLTNQADLNAAIISAVEGSEALSDLVEVEVVNGELQFTSKIDGANNTVDVGLNSSADADLSDQENNTLEGEYQAANSDSDLTIGTQSEVTATGNFANGTDSTAANNNVVRLAAGEDTVVLSTSSNASDTLVIDGPLGNASVLNFNAANDFLDLSAVLDSQESASGSEDSETRIATTVQTDTTLSANEVNVQSYTGTNELSFDQLSASNLLDVFDFGTEDYTNTETNVTLVDGQGKAVVMVENGDNAGEYKVFQVSFNGTDDTFELGAGNIVEVGTVDFGASIDVGQAVVDNAARTFTVAEAQSFTGTEDYAIADDLGAILTENANDAGSEELDSATAITVNDLGGEEIELTSLDSTTSTAGTAVNFTDDAATLSSDQLSTITGSGAGEFGLGLTDADAITVTGVAGADVVAVDGVLGGANDTIEVADDETVTLTSTQLQALDASLAPTSEGVGTDATLSVTGVANGDTLTATDLVDTFAVSGLAATESASIADFAMGDQVDTGVTAIAEGAAAPTADGTLEYFVNNDGTNTTITYELSDDGSASTTATVTLTGVQLSNADVSVDQGVVTFDNIA